MVRYLYDPYLRTQEWNWMPVIGNHRKALMLDTVVQFAPAGDVPIEADSDGEPVSRGRR